METNIRGKHIFENAVVTGSARVFGYARVGDDAVVTDRAEVSGRAAVTGDAHVSGDAIVSGSAVVEINAIVSGSAVVTDNAIVSGSAVVTHRAVVRGNAYVGGHARISGDAVILGGRWDGSEGEIKTGRWIAPGVPKEAPEQDQGMETINLTPTIKEVYDALKSIPIMGTAVICVSGREIPITRNDNLYEIDGTTYGIIGAGRIILANEAETEADTLEPKTVTLDTSHGTPTLKSAYGALQNMPEGIEHILEANDLVVSVRRVGDHYVVEGDELDRIKALKRVRESLTVENIRFRAHPGDFGRDGRLTMAATRSILTMAQRRPTQIVEVFVNDTVIATVSGSGPFEVEIIGEDTGSCPWSWVNASGALRRASKSSFETQVHRFDWTRKGDFLDMVQQGFACILEFRNGFVAQVARIPDSNRYEVYCSSTDCDVEVGMEDLVVIIDQFSTPE